MARRRLFTRPKKRLPKRVKWLIALVILALLPVLAGIGLKLWLTEDRLASMIEARLNVNVEIDEIELTLLRYPARIELRNLRLLPRQENTEATLIIDEGLLDVATLPLFRRRLDVRRIDIMRGELNYRLEADGSDNLFPLFESPAESGADLPGSDSAREMDTPAKPDVDDLDWGVGIHEIIVRDLSLNALIVAANLELSSPSMQLRAFDIELDPRHLDEQNRARLELAGDLSIDHALAPPVHYGLLAIDAQSSARLFDAQTREFDPDLDLELVLGPRSYLSTEMPTIQGWWEKIRIANRIGVPVGPLPEKARFDQHPIALHYYQDRITTKENVQLSLADWQAALLASSTYQIATTDHLLRAEFRTGQVEGRLVSDLFDDWIDKAPSWAGKTIKQQLKDKWITDGRIALRLSSRGTFHDPDIDLENELPSLESLLEDIKKDPGQLLRGILD